MLCHDKDCSKWKKVCQELFFKKVKKLLDNKFKSSILLSMRLKEWLTKNKIKPFHLSKVLDISPVTLHRHIVKERPLRGNIAIRIERYTKGKVTLKEMIVDKKEKN